MTLNRSIFDVKNSTKGDFITKSHTKRYLRNTIL